MRRWVPGMDEIDNAIVGFYQDLGEPGGEPVALSPALVHRNLVDIRGVLDCASNTISRHLIKLSDAGLLNRLEDDSAQYVLSDLGKRYPDDMTDNERNTLVDKL